MILLSFTSLGKPIWSIYALSRLPHVVKPHGVSNQTLDATLLAMQHDWLQHVKNYFFTSTFLDNYRLDF